MRIRTALIPIAIVALVAGCAQTPDAGPTGIAALTAEEIFEKTSQAIEEAGSYTVSGTIPTEELQLDDPELEGAFGEDATISLAINGDDAAVSVGDSTEAFEVRLVGSAIYVKLPADLLEIFTGGDPLAAALFAGKWIKASASDPSFSGFSGFATSPLDEIKGEAFTKGEESTINGTPVIALIAADGTIYVATTGEPYPVRVEAKDEDGTITTLDFSDVGSTPAIEAPAADQVLDLETLLGSLGG